MPSANETELQIQTRERQNLQPRPAEMAGGDARRTRATGVSARPGQRVRFPARSDRRGDGGDGPRLRPRPGRLRHLAFNARQDRRQEPAGRRRVQVGQRDDPARGLRPGRQLRPACPARASSSPTTTTKPSSGACSTIGCPSRWRRSRTSPTPTRATRRSKTSSKSSRCSKKTSSPTCCTSATTSSATARSSIRRPRSMRSPRSCSSRSTSNASSSRSAGATTSSPSKSWTSRSVTIR